LIWLWAGAEAIARGDTAVRLILLVAAPRQICSDDQETAGMFALENIAP
jgi:hypothetical protein